MKNFLTTPFKLQQLHQLIEQKAKERIVEKILQPIKFVFTS
jgi:hypothetical protein